MYLNIIWFGTTNGINIHIIQFASLCKLCYDIVILNIKEVFLCLENG